MEKHTELFDYCSMFLTWIRLELQKPNFKFELAEKKSLILLARLYYSHSCAMIEKATRILSFEQE